MAATYNFIKLCKNLVNNFVGSLNLTFSRLIVFYVRFSQRFVQIRSLFRLDNYLNISSK